MTIPSENNDPPVEQKMVNETTSNPKSSFITWTKAKLAGVVSLVAVGSLIFGSFLGVGFTLKVLELEHNYGHSKMMERPEHRNMENFKSGKKGIERPSDRNDSQPGLEDDSTDTNDDNSDENNDLK